MSVTRFSKFVLVVLALALWAGTAAAQTITSSTSTLSFSFTKGTATASQAATISDSGTGNSYSVGTPSYNLASASNQWLTATPGSGTTPEHRGCKCDGARFFVFR